MLGTSKSFFSVLSSMLTSTSPMAKMPTHSAMNSMPPASSIWSPVNRCSPENRSVPMVDRNRPMNIEMKPLSIESPASMITSSSANTISAEYSGGPKLTATSAASGARNVRPMTPMVPATNERDRRDPERLARAALLGHLVAVDARDDRRGLTGDVQQDRRRRTAVLGAVVDARHHDQAGRRLEAGGQRQQDRDRGGRPEAGQDADQRAQQAADDAATAGWSA